MNTVRIGVIAIWAAVGVSGYLSVRGAGPDEGQPAQATRVQAARVQPAPSGRLPTEHHAASARIASRDEAPPAPAAPAAPAFEPDTTDVTQPPQPMNLIADAVNADIGPEGEYVDPASLAETLRSSSEPNRRASE
jgi:hypothetical protein